VTAFVFKYISGSSYHNHSPAAGRSPADYYYSVQNKLTLFSSHGKTYTAQPRGYSATI